MNYQKLDLFYPNTIPTMILDSFENSHPIRFTVNDPKEINSLFDSISYEKGANIVRMMHSFLTTNTFKTGIRVKLLNNLKS